jgi:hypothetical protein
MSGRIYRYFLLLLLVLIPFYVEAEHCSVSQISLLAGPWESSSTKLSLALQTQDSSGNFCHTNQTLRFSLETNGTGSFTGQSGNTLQYFISSGSANRNFYYEGFSEDYILTAKAGYGTMTDWGVSFTDSYSSLTGSTTPIESASSTVRELDGESTSIQPSLSVHYGSPSLSKLKDPIDVLELSAGRERLGTTGSPMEFRIETNLSYDRNGQIKWNFGDGSEGSGDILTHTYYYPGEYIVIVNAVFPKGTAVARARVVVLEPDIEVVSVKKEYITIRNNSPYEVNLFGRAIWSSDGFFLFPQDTIMGVNQAISFSSEITKLSPIEVYDVQIMVIGDTERRKIGAKIKEQKEEKISLLKDKVAFLEKQLRGMSSAVAAPQPSTFLPSQSNFEVLDLVSTKKPTNNEGEVEAKSVGANVNWLQLLKSFLLKKNED